MVLIFPFFTRYRGEGQEKCQEKWESEKNHQSLRLTLQGHLRAGEYVDEENSLNQYLGFLAQWEPGLEQDPNTQLTIAPSRK